MYLSFEYGGQLTLYQVMLDALFAITINETRAMSVVEETTYSSDTVRVVNGEGD